MSLNPPQQSLHQHSTRNNSNINNRLLQENLAKFTNFEETYGKKEMIGGKVVKIFKKSELLGNGLNSQQNQNYSSSHTTTNKTSFMTTRCGNGNGGFRSASVMGDGDFIRRTGETRGMTYSSSCYGEGSTENRSENGITMSRRRGSVAVGAKDLYTGDDKLEEGGRVTKGRVTSWFLKYFGFPIYWFLVHIVVVEKWFLKRWERREAQDEFDPSLQQQGGYYDYNEQSFGGVRSYNYNGHSSTPTSTGHAAIDNGRFPVASTTSKQWKTFFRGTKISTAFEEGRLGLAKSMLFFWKKNAEEPENMGDEMRAEIENVRIRSHQNLKLDNNRQLSSGFVLGSAADTDGYKTSSSSTRRMQKKQSGLSSVVESDDEFEEKEETQTGNRFGICGFFLRVLVLLGIMAGLGLLAYLLWPAAASLAYGTWTFVTSCLSTLMTGSAGAFSFIASSLPVWPSKSEHQPEVPLTESVHLGSKNGHFVDSGSTEIRRELPPVVSAISRDDYNAILQKLRVIEETLEVHQEKLTFYEISYTRLQQQIVALDAAMKAATTKGKTPEQIFYEIMNFQIGETSDGKSVNLRNLMLILHANDEQANLKLDLKLQNIAEKLKEDSQSLQDKVEKVNNQLNILKEDQKNVVIETQTVAAEVDLNKIKNLIMPDLIGEMEKQVKISCLTRDCTELQEGARVEGFATADFEKLINIAISKYDSDKTGLPDLALESAGGSILSTRCTKSSKLRNSVVSLWGFRIWSPPNNPRTVIQPGVVPGECWAFEGSMGDVVIRLVSPSIVTGFTLEHIPKVISPYGNIDSAPYKFQVLGLNSEDDLDTVHDYGTFMYEDNGEPLQFFAAKNITTTPYPIVELKILSNHGNLLHTCLYRFRVHGALAIGGSQFTATVQTASEV